MYEDFAKLLQHCSETDCTECAVAGCPGIQQFCQHAANVIKELSKSNNNEVVGTWEWDPDGIDWGIGAWKCSNCGSKAETWWAKDGNSNPLKFAGSHYCGNCGATMRK